MGGFSSRSGWNRVGVAALGVVLALVTTATAEAASWGSPLIVPAADFANNGTNPGEEEFYSSEGYMSGRTNSVLTLVAPVQLPNGAVITRVEMAVFDIGDCASVPDVQLQLRSYNYGTGATLLHASVTSSNTTTMQVFADATVDSATVDNLSRGYYLVVNMCGVFQGFQGARIFYTE
jgi:hypothetical protein